MYWNVYWRPLCWEDKYIKHQVYLCKMASSYYLWILEYLQVQLFPNASRLIYSGIIYLNHSFFSFFPFSFVFGKPKCIFPNIKAFLKIPILSPRYTVFSINSISKLPILSPSYTIFSIKSISKLSRLSPNYQYYLPDIISSLLIVSQNFQDYLQTTNAIS